MATDTIAVRTGPARSLLGVSLKMYFDHEKTLDWCRAVARLARDHEGIRTGEVELFVLPSFLSVPAALEAFAGTRVAVGAQDLFWEDDGPFTGEVSGRDLASMGCRYVEIGHAERRAIFGEGDRMIGAKLAAAVRNGLVPVLCVGERAAVGAEEAARECIATIEAIVAASGIRVAERIVLAYEPEWAIGAQAAADPAYVAEVVSRVRARLEQASPFDSVSFIYGGSAGPGTLTALGDAVDGLFLGRFAHEPKALQGMLNESSIRRGASPLGEGLAR